MSLSVQTIDAQSYKNHKVKKKETLYGIATDNGLTVDQLIAANPGMEKPGFQLKKGDIIRVPVMEQDDVRQRAIRLGIMLPLNDDGNDGKRMVEYYRGVLMACDSLKKEGISVDVKAWNLSENTNLQTVLSDPQAASRDMIIGPFYEKFVSELSAFAKSHKIKLVVPFSIHAQEIYSNPYLFQIYQHHDTQNESTARRISEWFRDYHPVVVDGGDAASTKGAFTAILRQQLTNHNIPYNVTSLKSADADFAHAFAANMPNIVVLNTANTASLTALFTKLNQLLASYPQVKVSVFGYMDWMPYTDQFIANFHKYNMYLPAPFYTNLDTPLAKRLQTKYRWNFHEDMINILPRFALSGFDHAAFFLRGLHKYGAAFDGAAGRFGYQPSQTPLKFERIGQGGYQNRSYMFVHYKPEGTIETITY